MACKECTNQCMKPPHYTCSGKKEPNFLTEKQRKAHTRAFERGDTNWKFPFEPWVVRGWRKFSVESGLSERAAIIRQALLDGPKLAKARAEAKVRAKTPK